MNKPLIWQIGFWLGCAGAIVFWRSNAHYILVMPIAPLFMAGVAVYYFFLAVLGTCITALLLFISYRVYPDISRPLRISLVIVILACANYQLIRVARFEAHLYQRNAKEKRIGRDEISISNYRETPVTLFNLPHPAALQVEFDLHHPPGHYDKVSMHAWIQASDGKRAYLHCRSGYYRSHALQDGPITRVTFLCKPEELQDGLKDKSIACVAKGTIVHPGRDHRKFSGSAITGSKYDAAGFQGATVHYEGWMQIRKASVPLERKIMIGQHLQRVIPLQSLLADPEFWKRALVQLNADTFHQANYTQCIDDSSNLLPPLRDCYCPPAATAGQPQ